MDQVQTVIAEDSAPLAFVDGHGLAMTALNTRAAELARTDIPVLILGESGTGKDAYARLIHRLSPQGSSRLRKINCSAFDSNHFLSHLNEAMNSFSGTGAVRCVYLDNIHELDLAAQRLLLSQLPDAETSGAADDPKVRFISSTSMNLESEVAAGRFRRELYFRLNGACLRLPPLRERLADIPVLAEFFLSKHSALMKKKVPALSQKAMQSLTAYHWPGNIRELENFTRQIVVLGDVQMVLNDLRSSTIDAARPAVSVQGASLKVAARAASKQAERELILQALDHTRWNRKRAARELQISYKSLLYKIKQMEVIPGERQRGGGED